MIIQFVPPAKMLAEVMLLPVQIDLVSIGHTLTFHNNPPNLFMETTGKTDVDLLLFQYVPHWFQINNEIILNQHDIYASMLPTPSNIWKCIDPQGLSFILVARTKLIFINCHIFPSTYLVNLILNIFNFLRW